LMSKAAPWSLAHRFRYDRTTMITWFYSRPLPAVLGVEAFDIRLVVVGCLDLFDLVSRLQHRL
jgi:hypothetical protein